MNNILSSAILSRVEVKKMIFLIVCSCWFWSRAEAQVPSTQPEFYFPPTTGEWERKSASELGWDQAKLGEFLAWLPTQDTRAFIILKDGKIVVEQYWGSKLTGTGLMDEKSFWYWASAGKTLTAALVGIAQQEKLLSTKDRTQKYLGEGWSSLAPSQERAIKLIHKLTMTTGLDDRVSNLDDTSASSLQYLAKPGSRWSYHNAPYTLLEKVVESATGQTFQSYFKSKIGDRIGMRGFWQQTGYNNVFYSDARSFARFGLLLLSKGQWGDSTIWEGDYFDRLCNTSQKLNESYGYLTWLNGKSSYMVPGSQKVIQGSMIPSAPDDMYQAIGKNGQYLMIVPSQNLVVLRMGGASSEVLVPVLLMKEIWDRLSKVIPY